MLWLLGGASLRSVSLLPLVVLTRTWLLSSAMSASTGGTSSSSVQPPQHIVVVGGGIQGTSVAYHLAQRTSTSGSASKTKITLLESQQPASAASGKGGGFMARSWGDGSPTQGLHHVAFDMYEGLAKELGCTSYRKLPVLSVAPGKSGSGKGRGGKQGDPVSKFIPSWLDGSTGRISRPWDMETIQHKLHHMNLSMPC